MSHELRTPLTPVLATVTAMADDPATPEGLRPVLEMIRRNVALEARLIDDLLDLARIDRGTLCLKRELVDAHELVDRVIAICRDDLERGALRLIVDLSAADHHLDADPIRLQQVLWNLLKNAIKFTPAGGTVTVRSFNGVPADGGCDAGQHDGVNGDSPSAARMPCLLIEVSDTGIGIEPELLPRVFDVLEQGASLATRSFGGLGLGLTISRSIALQHGGHLAAASPGKGMGATFTVEMPAVAVAAGSAQKRPAPPLDEPELRGAGPRMRILLVDDNADTLKSLARLFGMRGYLVQSANSLRSALAIAAETEFDVLVSDIELPDGNGLELMSRLRDIRVVPAIALSGFGAREDVEQSLAAGFALHLVKPIDFRRLERAVREVAGAGAAESLAQG